MSESAQRRPRKRPNTEGTRLPLPVLPLYPAVAGYQALVTELNELGFQHAAEVIRAPVSARPLGTVGTADDTDRARATRILSDDGGFRVLDGMWFPGRGRGVWILIDPPFLQDCQSNWLASADPRATRAAAVLRTLRAITLTDPMGLRRLVLYQLACLLKDTRGRATEQDALALGVHEDEAEPLAAAVNAGFPAQGPTRQAAETIVDAWQARRLRQVQRLAADLPADPADHVLAGMLVSMRRWADRVHGEMSQAELLQRQGNPSAAAGAWRRVLRMARDDQRAMTGLISAGAQYADAPDRRPEAEVKVHITGRTVRVSWQAPAPAAAGTTGTVRFQVMRFPDGLLDQGVDLSPDDTPAALSGTSRYDTAAPVGQPLRYAVLPMRGDQLAGVPRVSASLVLTPEVDHPAVTLVPDGLSLTWQPHPEAVQIRLRRMSAQGSEDLSRLCGPRGFVDRPLPPGDHAYLVSCGYRGLDGTMLFSPGRVLSGTADQWPSAVPELTVHGPQDDGRVTIAWTPPERGRARLVPWRERPVATGEDVSDLLGRLFGAGSDGAPPAEGPVAPSGAPGEKISGQTTAWPAELTEPGRMTLAPAERSATRITAVSVLGERAVSGPSVLIESPGTVTDLAAYRLPTAGTQVWFTWPEPAVLVLVGWEQMGLRHEQRVARSHHRTAPVEVPTTWHECRITVTPIPRPDADVVVFGTAHVWLPEAPELRPPPPRVSTRDQFFDWANSFRLSPQRATAIRRLADYFRRWRQR